MLTGRRTAGKRLHSGRHRSRQDRAVPGAERGEVEAVDRPVAVHVQVRDVVRVRQSIRRTKPLVAFVTESGVMSAPFNADPGMEYGLSNVPPATLYRCTAQDDVVMYSRFRVES